MNKLPEINEVRLPCCWNDWGGPFCLSIQGSNNGLRVKIITKSGRTDSVYLNRESLVELNALIEQRLEVMKMEVQFVEEGCQKKTSLQLKMKGLLTEFCYRLLGAFIGMGIFILGIRCFYG